MNRLFLITGLLAVLLAGCSRHKPETAMPPLRVGVAEAVTDSVPNRMEFIGYLASNFDAVIQPRVNGYLLTKQFANGMPVKRGQLLFTIDPDQLSTSMLAAEAALQSARAQAIEARNNSKENIYIQKAYLNGKELKQPRIPFAAIVSGGTLLLEMGDKPKFDCFN